MRAPTAPGTTIASIGPVEMRITGCKDASGQHTTLNGTIQSISEHAPKARKPHTKEQFGYFLAGLIDADGHIDTLGYMRIVFNQKDVSVAYYIKKIIGYGSIKKIKGKAAYLFTCSHSKGIKIMGDLICNKLKTMSKIEQFNARLVSKVGGKLTKLNSAVVFNNHWLAGFIQGDGSFQIKVLYRQHRTEIRLAIQIDQNSDTILKEIQSVFGGYIGYRNSQNTYYYSSVGFSNAARLIQYLDKYQVMGSCLTVYWIWRKAYLRVQNKTHNTEQGISEIINFKNRMSIIKKFLTN